MTKSQNNVSVYRKQLVRGNKLMTAKFNLSLPEYKTVLMAMHNVQTKNEAFLSMEDFKNYIAPKSKNAKKDFIELMEKLTDKSVYIASEYEDRKTFTKYKWLSSYTSEFNITGKRLVGCHVKMDSGLKQFLTELNSNFTKMYLTDIFKLQSFASVRIFEILYMMKKDGTNQRFRMTVDSFKKYVGFSDDEYTEFKYLNNQVVKKVVKELNDLESANVEIEYEKNGKNVVALIFNFSIKEEHQFIENPLLSEIKGENPVVEFIKSDKLPEYVHITSECQQLFENDFGYIDFNFSAFGKAMASAWLNVKTYTKGDVVALSNYEYFRTTLNNAISTLDKEKVEDQQKPAASVVPSEYYHDWIAEILM